MPHKFGINSPLSVKHSSQKAFLRHALGGQCSTYHDYISRIERRLVRDLKNEYPQAELYGDESAVDVLQNIFAQDDTAQFIFVLDAGAENKR